MGADVLSGGWHSNRKYGMIMIARQIRKLLERFLKPKEATRIHKRRNWLCRLSKYYKFVKATPNTLFFSYKKDGHASGTRLYLKCQ